MKAAWNKLVLWFWTTLFCWFIALYLGLIKRRKMSHNNGVSGTGSIRVVDDQTFPAHPFFAPGRTFSARVRHASAGFLDDGMRLVRSLSIKFNDARVDSPFDLELNNGRSLFWNARNFLEFVKLRRNKRGVCYTDWYAKYPEGRAAAQDSIAVLPDSYHTLEYTSQTPTWWIGADGLKRYACYRVVPHGQPAASLKSSEAEIGRFDGNQQLDPDEPRDRNYLKREWADRVMAGPIEYLLQVQTRPAQPEDDPAIFNANKPWSSDAFPWHDLAVITIDTPLDWQADQLMWFSLRHAPEGLGILPARSMDDPNSINYMRVKSDIAKKVRTWWLRRGRIPPPLPAEGPRNVDEFNAPELLYPDGIDAAAKEQTAIEASRSAAG